MGEEMWTHEFYSLIDMFTRDARIKYVKELLPSELVPDGMRQMNAPVEAIDNRNGNIVVDDTVPDDDIVMILAESMQLKMIAPYPSFDAAGCSVYTMLQRREIIVTALAEAKEHGMDYVLSVSVVPAAGKARVRFRGARMSVRGAK